MISTVTGRVCDRFQASVGDERSGEPIYVRLKALLFHLVCFVGRVAGRPAGGPVDAERITNILIVALGGIGDALRIFPVMDALHSQNPVARMTVLISCPPDALSLAPSAGAITAVVRTTAGGSPRRLGAKLALIRSLRRQRFDLIVDPSRGEGFIENDIRSFLIGAPVRVGFYKSGAGFLHTHAVEFSDSANLVEQNLALLDQIGIRPASREFTMRVPADAERTARAIAGGDGSAEFTIAIHPGAKEPTRRWPAASYAALAERILKHGRTRILVLGEAAERAAYGELFASFDPSRLVDCVGRTSLLEVAALIRSAGLFIGNDSSLLHIAIALRTPCLALFGPTSAKQLLPAAPMFRSVDSCRWIREEGRTLPCYMHQPIFISPPCVARPCITAITVDDAWAAIRPLLPPQPGSTQGGPVLAS